MKRFLQEGLHTYAPALIALSEFRRQIRSRLQAVLDEFAIQFSELGLPVANLKPLGAKLDDVDLSESSSSIELQRHHGAGLYGNYHVRWDLGKPKDQQIWVGTWIFVGVRADRDRLFEALQKQRSPLSKTDLEQFRDGSPKLSYYCDSDLFYSFDDAFRVLIEEWVGLLSGVGGIQPFLSASAAALIPQDNQEN